ncbi:MAG TPA: MurT ligase domain-containing protein [Acidimicrobiales bacterium]|nr:MurT ligase domain-containing protein [Acidimicrobiales bacterium]
MTPRLRRLRLAVATALGDAAGWSSRRLGRGSGEVVSGRVIQTLAPDALTLRLDGRPIVLISGTNGKSTTTALLAAAAHTRGPVATNDKGANMPAGIVTALGHTTPGATAVLEVDEGYVPALLSAAAIDVLVLLNLSRDQLDRVAEVRKTAERWRQGIAASPATTVVANADDPAVVFAARASAHPVWVAAGSNWRVDATSCPNCGERIHFDGDEWNCTQCDLVRPAVQWAISTAGSLVVAGDDVVDVPVVLEVPGRHNQTNAVMALAAADAIGIPIRTALDAMSSIRSVEGRYEYVWGESSTARLYLSKNPAGWIEIIELLMRSTRRVLIVINAEIADGKDTSWLWDVPFERLHGRHAIAAGRRCHDLAVRLLYADVDVITEPDLDRALALARADDCDVVANYTAFREVRRALGVAR